MVNRQIKVSKAMLFTWLMLASIILLVTPSRITNQFHLAFVGLFRPVLSFGRGAPLSVSVTNRPISENEASRLYQKYQQLQIHCENLRAELRQERQNVEKLSGLRNMFAFERAKLVLADVVTGKFDETGRRLIINRGQVDGLAVGDFVLGGNSIIGLISDVSPGMATVRLTTDPACKLPVQIAHSDVYIRGVMQGDRKNVAKISRMKYPVEIGDYVKTYKEPWFVDTPVVIGRVTKCEENDHEPLLWDVTVSPVCNVEVLEEVAVIILNPEYRN